MEQCLEICKSEGKLKIRKKSHPITQKQSKQDDEQAIEKSRESYFNVFEEMEALITPVCSVTIISFFLNGLAAIGVRDNVQSFYNFFNGSRPRFRSIFPKQ
uniref:Uncharacterized protein n=1 Tax=Glossina austeni TaxID=7395 RepID=A0A1A9V0Y6_GLOAU